MITKKEFDEFERETAIKWLEEKGYDYEEVEYGKFKIKQKAGDKLK